MVLKNDFAKIDVAMVATGLLKNWNSWNGRVIIFPGVAQTIANILTIWGPFRNHISWQKHMFHLQLRGGSPTAKGSLLVEQPTATMTMRNLILKA